MVCFRPVLLAILLYLRVLTERRVLAWPSLTIAALASEIRGAEAYGLVGKGRIQCFLFFWII